MGSLDDVIQSILDRQVERFYHELKLVLSEIQPQEESPLTIDQACEYLNLSKPTVYLLVQKKKIPHYKKCSRLYFYKTELNIWIKEGKLSE